MAFSECIYSSYDRKEVMIKLDDYLRQLDDYYITKTAREMIKEKNLKRKISEVKK